MGIGFGKWAAKKGLSMLVPKPKPTKTESIKVWGQKARGKFKKDMEQPNEAIDKVLTQSQKLLQKVKGEKITKSGRSKAKDIK